MKKFLLVVSLLLGLIAGLTPSHHNAVSAQSDTNTITIGVTDLPVVLDPAQTDDFMSWEVLRHLYTGLTRQIVGTNDYELALASNHEISADGLTHTFTLREDAQFSDGTPISAAHFAYGINRVLALDYPPAKFLEDIGLQVRMTEDGKLVLTTSRPIPYLEGLVALPMFFPLLERDFPADAVNSFPATLTGNGVYMLDDFDPGDYIRLKANPNYSYGDPAKTETILLKRYVNSEELRLALVAQEVDLTWRDVLLTDADELVQNNADIRLINVPSSRMWYLTLNRKFDYLDDPVVRASLMMTLDRDRIVREDFGGYLTPAYSLVPQSLETAYNPLWQITPDPTTAEQNLRDAGYRESRFNQANFPISTSTRAYGTQYAGALVSITRDTRPIRLWTVTSAGGTDPSTFQDALTSGDIQGALFAWTPIVMHPDAYLYPLLHSEGVLARRNNYALSQVDALLEEAALTNNPELYSQAQALVAEESSIAPLWQDTLVVLTSDSIGGITIEANFFLHYELLVRN